MDGLLKLFISTYGFLLHHNQTYTWKEWAEEIKRHYSLDSDRNFIAFTYLSSTRYYGNTIRFSITRIPTVIIVQ